MMKNDYPLFREKEDSCSFAFLTGGPFWHLCTPENHPVVFTSIADYKAGVSILGLCAKLYSDITVITFELMSNHAHVIASGRRSKVLAFWEAFIKFLCRYFNGENRGIHLDRLTPVLYPIDSLDYLRNSICYVNRNGSVIDRSCTPFSYPWGANAFYYNPLAVSYYLATRKPMAQYMRQRLTHSRVFDNVEGVYVVNGAVCPVCFCDIKTGEFMFRTASHYFSVVSRNLEVHRDLATLIGEQNWYTDDDLFAMVRSIVRERFGNKNVNLLSNEEKIQLAKTLHFDYSATNRQISRLLRMDISVVDALFPASPAR